MNNKVNFPNLQTNSWKLNRRHMLKGLGVSLSLPFLNVMSSPKPNGPSTPGQVRRSVFVYFPNGVNGMKWQVQKSGKDYELSSSLQPLEQYKNNLTVFSGLHHPKGIGQAHVCADSWLTGASINAQSGRSYNNSISCDQVIAGKIGMETRYPSIEMSIRSGTGKPFGSNTLSFSREGVPLPALARPTDIFKRLFHNDPSSLQHKRNQLAKDKSILDSVLSHAQKLKTQIGAEDKTKLDEYFYAVRDLELRTSRMEQWLDVPYPKVEEKVKARFKKDVPREQSGEYWRTMFDLIVLALQTDMTRTVTYMSGTEGIGLAIPEIKITASRHNLSHHNGDPLVLDRLAQWDHFFMKQFAYFLGKLQDIKEADSNLLDNTMILCGSGMSYGHSHSNGNLPILFAGGSGLGIKHGQHIDYNRPFLKNDYTLDYKEWKSLCGRPKDDKARLSNLLLTMIQKMDVPCEKFADSIAPVSEIL